MGWFGIRLGGIRVAGQVCAWRDAEERKFQISDLKFQIRETAKATATADANADPSA